MFCSCYKLFKFLKFCFPDKTSTTLVCSDNKTDGAIFESRISLDNPDLEMQRLDLNRASTEKKKRTLNQQEENRSSKKKKKKRREESTHNQSELSSNKNEENFELDHPSENVRDNSSNDISSDVRQVLRVPPLKIILSNGSNSVGNHTSEETDTCSSGAMICDTSNSNNDDSANDFSNRRIENDRNCEFQSKYFDHLIF